MPRELRGGPWEVRPESAHGGGGREGPWAPRWGPWGVQRSSWGPRWVRVQHFGFAGRLCPTLPRLAPGVARRPQPRKVPFWQPAAVAAAPPPPAAALLSGARLRSRINALHFRPKPPPRRGEMLPSGAHFCAHPWPFLASNCETVVSSCPQRPELGAPQRPELGPIKCIAVSFAITPCLR